MRAPNTKPTDEMIYTENSKVSCEGSGGALGHPKVYLDLSKDGEVFCPYCSRHFILKKK